MKVESIDGLNASPENKTIGFRCLNEWIAVEKRAAPPTGSDLTTQIKKLMKKFDRKEVKFYTLCINVINIIIMKNC